MNEISVLIAGKAGYGIDKSGSIIASLFNHLGYRIYIYRDYPSLIRGGHTFSIIRASGQKISTHRNNVDFLLALNQDTIDFHKQRLKDNSIIIYDSDSVKLPSFPVEIQSFGIPVAKILKTENAADIMRNTCIIGAFCKAAGIGKDIMEKVIKKSMAKETELNTKIAVKGFDETGVSKQIDVIAQVSLPIITGNEAISLGLIKGGLQAYISYPMTPCSGILHFLAEMAEEFSLKVVHPENEISVMLMALGFSYMGEKVAVGTSGGGFCLMTEGFSFSGMAELPVVVIVGQRPGPSTGLPTYTGQTELHFVLNAGQGEFCRFVVAPGDAEEAYYWSGISMNIAQKYQTPAIILSDKTLSEGASSFDIAQTGPVDDEKGFLWDRKGEYKRYLNSETGISQLAFPPDKDVVIKVNSYEHDESGITAEEAGVTNKMLEKRMRKEAYLSSELEDYKTVNVAGNRDSPTGVVCWGSNKGVVFEAAANLGLRAIHPVVLWPFPRKQFQDALNGITKLVCVENNATGQLAKLISQLGYKVDHTMLRYDGRPFSLDELEEKLRMEI